LSAGSRYFTQNAQQVVGMASISQPQVSRFPLPLPPLPEQRRIVAELEKQFTRLEAGVAALRRVQVNLKRYRAAVLKAACEGQLVPAEAELHRQRKTKTAPLETGAELLTRILADRRKHWSGRGKYKEPAAPDTANLPQPPEGWTWASMEQISTKVVDGVHKKPNYVPSGIPFVTVRNLTAGPGISFEKLNYITPEDHEEFIKRANPEPGDILVSKDGTLGVIRVIKTEVTFSIFVSVAMVKPVLREISSFLGHALSAPQVQAQMIPKGSGLQHIHLEDLREDCVPLPPLPEQTRIVAEVERRLSVVEELESVVSANLQSATRLRQSILQKAFTGELIS
jgi:type I restriction enzyme S subunit